MSSRPPLTSIIASGEILAEELGKDHNPTSKLIRNLNESAQDMNGKVSELLDIAKMGAGNLN
jgi:signal transduction histidine kinase